MADEIYTVAYDSETSADERAKPVPADIAIGIDIGTSKCSFAIWNGAEVEVLQNTQIQSTIPSHVLFKDEMPPEGFSYEVPRSGAEILSGSDAFNMKRLIGRVDTDPVVKSSKMLPFMVQTFGIGQIPLIAVPVNNVWRSTTPEEVLAIFLAELKENAEHKLKRPIRKAVLTVPISFSRLQLTRIEQACAMAGIHVFRLMPEPTAVALLYAQQQQQQIIHENMGSGMEKVALIFSMGAGFCDVAITITAGGVSQIKALLGIPVGGEDMLQNIIHYLFPDFGSLEKMKSNRLLRIAVQNAIHELSSQTSVEVKVDLRDGKIKSRSLTRVEFEEVNHKVFVKCEKLIAQCLLDARLTAEDLSDVILVGGCSSVPKIRSLVLSLCKKEDSYDGIDPLEASVRGAATEGAIASGASDASGSLDLLTIQVTTTSLGIRVDGGDFVPIIRRNTSVPVRKEMVFTTANDDQAEALVVVYEGESRRAEENIILGYFKITGIPSGPRGSAEVGICMDVDTSNVLRVYGGAHLLRTQQAVSPFLEVRMPMADIGQGWSVQALVKIYGSTMDLAATPPNEVQK
ncbi:Heat shock 70 kDa protein 8 [Platanthera zijinensis]|uniref:Heat shock 70 kDa protein 8 n=1 Tax=Platanthera zijinensis TaxID=2320716 RepID=A0AAP0GB21_9ASPA